MWIRCEDEGLLQFRERFNGAFTVEGDDRSPRGYQAFTSIDVLLISQRLRRIDSNGSLRWMPTREYRDGNEEQ